MFDEILWLTVFKLLVTTWNLFLVLTEGLWKLDFYYSSTDIQEVGNNRVSSNMAWLLSSAQLRNRFRKNSWSTHQQTRTAVHACCENIRFGAIQFTSVHLLTYTMVQSPSWEANWFAANQEIPRISWNPKVHYRTHKRPPPIPILGQPNPLHTPTSHLLEIHPNIIHPSTPRSPQWSLSLRFPHQYPIRLPVLPPTRHMPCPSHSSRFYHPHNIRYILAK